jgi:NAD(P)-dependent dehydrogenase (short-subunit alcohol dehydrogenase family)
MSEKAPTDNFVFPSFTKTWHTKPYPFIDPTRPELSAKGKNVVITGGGTGIGNAIGVGFAKAGAKSIVILGRRVEKLEAGKAAISAAAGSETSVTYKSVDLVNKEQTTKAFDSIAQEFGKIDVMVVNAGVYGNAGKMATFSGENLLQTLELNVISVLNTFQAFLPHAADSAVLLHSSSAMAHIAAVPGSGGYPIAKAAALKLMDYVAAENSQLRVISTQPAWTPTDLNGNDKNATDSRKTFSPVSGFSLTFPIAELPGCFYVWLASSEAEFLKNKFVWSNWDAQELIERKEEIKSSKSLLTWGVEGVPM